MKKVSIDTSKVGRKAPTKLDINVGLIKKSLAYRGKLFDLNKEDKNARDDDNVDAFDFLMADNSRMERQITFTVDFLEDVLELSDKEIAKLDSLSWEELNDLAGEVNTKIMKPDNEEGTEDGKPSKSK